MSHISGDFTIAGPAPAIEQTPEQAEAAAEKLARAREARRAARAAKATGSSVGNTSPSSAQQPQAEQGSSDEPQTMAPQPSSERQAALLALETERTELLARAAKLGLPDYTGLAVRHLRGKVQDAEAAAEQASRPKEPIEIPDDGPYQAARQTFENAQAHVTELEREAAGLPGLLQDAINAGDAHALATHRQRQAVIAAELDMARLGALDAQLAMTDAEAPLIRTQAQIAAAKAAERAEDMRRAQQDLYALQGEVDDARARRSELAMHRGNLLRQRDDLRAAMLAGSRS